jgi:hypothetical protein
MIPPLVESGYHITKFASVPVEDARVRGDINVALESSPHRTDPYPVHVTFSLPWVRLSHHVDLTFYPAIDERPNIPDTYLDVLGISYDKTLLHNGKFAIPSRQALLQYES